MDSSETNSPADGAAANKRKRVSRACDACFSKKDRCDGVQPVCKVCKAIGRSCTYLRPERKRGPSQGVRQRLEAQVESLESILGYVADTYPYICSDVIRNLRLEEVEGAMLKSLPSSSSSPYSINVTTLVNVFPHYSRQDARDRWRRSSLAKAVAPSLGLILAGEEEDDEGGYGIDGVRYRIEEARLARARIRDGIPDGSPMTPHYHHHRPAPMHYPAPSHSSNYQLPYSQQPPLHYPPYPQQQHPKERSYPPPQHQQQHQQSGVSSAPHYLSSFTPEQTNHHPFAYSSQLPYTRPPDNFPTIAPIASPIESFGSYSTNGFEGEADALAYALGLTYAASPQNSQLSNRPIISSSHSSNWLGPSSSMADSQGDIMRSIDQHMQSTSNDNAAADDIDEQHTAALDFFADHDLQPDQQQLSVLHQLGLQGSIDMPTPVDSSDRGNTVSSSVHDDMESSNSSNSHLHSNHWLQPIRGIN